MLLSIQGVGRPVKDPDVRYLPGSDNAVAVFSLATSTKYKDKEQSCFVECVVFGKRAEAVGTYLRKGAKVYVRGTLQQDVWEQDGQKRSKHKVLVEQIDFCEGKKEGGPGAFDAPSGGMDEDDIPF